jgi:hypothetical protein
MFDKCVRSTNTGSGRCSVCGALPAEVHKAGPLLGKRLYCPSCCVACARKPAPQVERAAAKDKGTRADGCGAPAGSGDAWYCDTKNEREARVTRAIEGWLPRRPDWLRPHPQR